MGYRQRRSAFSKLMRRLTDRQIETAMYVMEADGHGLAPAAKAIGVSAEVLRKEIEAYEERRASNILVV